MSGGQTSSLMKDVFFVFMSLIINRKRKGSCLLHNAFESPRYFECNQSSLSAERYYG